MSRSGPAAPRQFHRAGRGCRNPPLGVATNGAQGVGTHLKDLAAESRRLEQREPISTVGLSLSLKELEDDSIRLLRV